MPDQQTITAIRWKHGRIKTLTLSVVVFLHRQRAIFNHLLCSTCHFEFHISVNQMRTKYAVVNNPDAHFISPTRSKLYPSGYRKSSLISALKLTKNLLRSKITHIGKDSFRETSRVPDGNLHEFWSKYIVFTRKPSFWRDFSCWILCSVGI